MELAFEDHWLGARQASCPKTGGRLIKDVQAKKTPRRVRPMLSIDLRLHLAHREPRNAPFDLKASQLQDG
jgi:hypothetical protein